MARKATGPPAPTPAGKCSGLARTASRTNCHYSRTPHELRPSSDVRLPRALPPVWPLVLHDADGAVSVPRLPGRLPMVTLRRLRPTALLAVAAGGRGLCGGCDGATLAAQRDGGGMLRHSAAYFRRGQFGQREREAIHFGPVLTGDSLSPEGHQAARLSLHSVPLRVRGEDVSRFGDVCGLCLCHVHIRTEALRFVKWAGNGLFSRGVTCAC